MGDYNTTTTTIGPGGQWGTFVHVNVYGKVQVGPNVDTQRQIEERKRKEACLLPKIVHLATYIGYWFHVSTSLC